LGGGIKGEGFIYKFIITIPSPDTACHPPPKGEGKEV
jgi:hypothetical protein